MNCMKFLYRAFNCLVFLGLFLYIFASCKGENGSKGLSYDESITDEQQIELLQLQANSFADSIKSAGYNVLGIFVDADHHSVFYARKGLSTADGDGHTSLLPIRRKNIKTGNDQIVQIPEV